MVYGSPHGAQNNLICLASKRPLFRIDEWLAGVLRIQGEGVEGLENSPAKCWTDVGEVVLGPSGQAQLIHR